MASLRTFVGIIALSGLPGLTSCAVVDQYSGRAVAYNVEAEQAQEQALLLNVVRAYLRRPMQFTTVSSITGAASATGGVGYTAPVNIPFRPPTNGSSIASFPALNTWSMSAGMSGGPTFTVPVLDTQEFYEGIMNPIPGLLYDLYNKSDYPRDLLFNLFVQRVVMTLVDDGKDGKCANANPKRRPTKDCEFEFDNYVGNEISLQLFQALGDYLLYLGLSTEATPPSKNDFFYQDWKNKKNLIGLEVKLSGSSPSGGSSSDSASSSSKQSKSYGFCFSPHTEEAALDVPDRPYWCVSGKPQDSDDNLTPQPSSGGRTAKKPQRGAKPDNAELDANTKDIEAKSAERITRYGSATGEIRASSAFIEKLIRIAQDPTIHNDDRDMAEELQTFSGKRVYLSFSLRSVESMIYYLGEISRRELAPEYETPRAVFIKTGARYASYTQDPCTAPTTTCQPLFVLKKDTIPHSDDLLTAYYDKNWYTVPSMAGGGGWSSAVLEIVKQQLALNSSAKALPQSNVISVVGQ